MHACHPMHHPIRLIFTPTSHTCSQANSCSHEAAVRKFRGGAGQTAVDSQLNRTRHLAKHRHRCAQHLSFQPTQKATSHANPAARNVQSAEHMLLLLHPFSHHHAAATACCAAVLITPPPPLPSSPPPPQPPCAPPLPWPEGPPAAGPPAPRERPSPPPGRMSAPAPPRW